MAPRLPDDVYVNALTTDERADRVRVACGSNYQRLAVSVMEASGGVTTRLLLTRATPGSVLDVQLTAGGGDLDAT